MPPKNEKLKINRIKIVLAELDITHKELAKRVGKVPNSITRICNNESQPTIKLLWEIAHALDIDIRELLIPTKP
ncbi:MAG: helix-turn-helix transcriptional regulator [Chitinophagaceae bacterium]